MRKVLVIGGGAAGMTAAVFAARQGAYVTVLEQKDLTGKKILSTGNGRCNLTNLSMGPEYYRGGDSAFVGRVLEAFSAEDTLAFFESLGLETRARGTYVYPLSGQAAAVREALAMELRRREVQVLLKARARTLRRTKKGWEVRADVDGEERVCTADRVILAAGGRAFPALGSDGSGYTLAKMAGHSLEPVLPALVQLRSGEGFFKKLSGVRADACVRLLVEKEPVAEDTGEVQFTDYGLSGIPVFQVSRYASRALRQGRQVTAVLDFLPDRDREEVAAALKRRRGLFAENSAEEFLHGIFHRKLAAVLLTRSRVRWQEKAGELTEEMLGALTDMCKRFEVPVTGTNSFEQAQVCAGGVPLGEVRADTMESLAAPGLYLAGELLDVDGMCGGYNLQWAWATGAIAGRSASE